MMYERFTDRAWKVIQIAAEEAQRRGHGYVGTEHLLLALFIDGSGVAVNTLQNLRQSPVKIRRKVERITAVDDASPSVNEPPMTPRMKSVIVHAMVECRALNHHYVGTEHLLLGLIHDQDSFAGVMLAQLGLKLNPVRDEIQRLLGYTEASP